VLQNLVEEQKDRHLTLCMDFAEQLQEDNFLECVITGVETLCYQYDSEAKMSVCGVKIEAFHQAKEATNVKSP
jgi:adenosine deaminase